MNSKPYNDILSESDTDTSEEIAVDRNSYIFCKQGEYDDSSEDA